MSFFKSTARVIFAAVTITLLLAGALGIKQYSDDVKISEYRYVVTQDRLQEIYRKLVLSTGQYVLPSLIIIRSAGINADTDGNAVYVNQGIINQFENDDEAALVLGHEIAHILLGHTSFKMPVPQTIKEAQADKYGAFLMMKSGFDVCKGRGIFFKIKDLFGDDPTSDHPALAYRVDQLNVGCDKN